MKSPTLSIICRWRQMRIIHNKQTQKNKQEWIHQRMVQNPLSSNDRVHWTVQIFQDDDWRRNEKRSLRHDRKINHPSGPDTPSTNTINQECKFPSCVGKKNHVVIYHPWMRINENHPLQFTFLLDDEPACALVCCCESCVILLRDLCGIFRCLHGIARADRGQERQKQREKQRKCRMWQKEKEKWIQKWKYRV
jgi:hypothetical protein